MELFQTAMDEAADAVLGLLSDGPMPTMSLMESMIEAGHARNTVELAKRKLKHAGRIVITRPGSRRNPYFVSLVE